MPITHLSITTTQLDGGKFLLLAFPQLVSLTWVIRGHGWFATFDEEVINKFSRARKVCPLCYTGCVAPLTACRCRFSFPAAAPPFSAT